MKEYYLYLNMVQLLKINGFFRVRLDSILDIYVSLKNVIEKNNKIAIWEWKI